MTWRKLLLITLMFSVLGGVTVFADDAIQVYSKKIMIYFNGDSTNINAVNVSGTTMIPLRSVSDTLGAMVDSQPPYDTVNVYKPNVNITLFEYDKTKYANPFFGLKKGVHDFKILAEVDSLKTKVYSLKVTIEDPYENEIKSQVQDLTGNKDNFFWFTMPVIDFDFKYTGSYHVKFYLKADKDSDYVLISQKVIQSRAE